MEKQSKNKQLAKSGLTVLEHWLFSATVIIWWNPVVSEQFLIVNLKQYNPVN